MVKFFGRLSIKQFIRNKPVCFGIKLWALCGADGFMFDCNIKSGKNYTADKLQKIALGSRVVMNLLEDLLMKTVYKRLSQYHLYFDNYFNCPDLFIHLQKIGLQATGVVRKDRIKEKNELDKKAIRGTHVVKHDKNSGLNYITLMDSKEVSILSTAAGVSPLKTARRYSKKEKNKKEIPMPAAFLLYNKNMGGVDVHDQYCSKVFPTMRSKKWTFSIFVRLIQSSLTNAVILKNSVRQKEKKTSMKDFAVSVATIYLQRKSKKIFETHIFKNVESRRYCSGDKCEKRITSYCLECNKHFCKVCFNLIHKVT